jgi:hypothetical protein
LLYAALLKKLREPIHLDISHRNFLSQTFGIESIDEIRDFLCADSQDNMTFFDWLFYPDETFQVQIESILSGSHISAAEQDDLIDRLAKNNIQTTIQLDATTYQSIILGPMIISPFISRLGLKRHIPKELIEIQYINEIQKNHVLVYLRNETIDWTDNRRYFINRIILAFLSNQDELLNVLSQMLNFCGQYQHNFMHELTRRKHQLLQNLERFQNFQTLQEKHSMEFLVSSGIRSIHVDVRETKAEIAVIDNVLLAVHE